MNNNNNNNKNWKIGYEKKLKRQIDWLYDEMSLKQDYIQQNMYSQNEAIKKKISSEKNMLSFLFEKWAGLHDKIQNLRKQNNLNNKGEN